MAINRYDSPAEAQFIDTYVPIPFEKLYTLGKQAKEEVDKALADAATAFKEWGEFQSLSQKDIQTFYDETKGKALPVVNDLIKNPDKIKTVEGRMALQSVINNVDSAKLSALRQSAENMATYDKLTKELMMKGLYNPDWHYRDFSNYDSTQGMFNETPIAYMDINEISKPYMDQMEKGYIGSDGMYDYYGNTEDDLKAVANAHLTDMINTPQGQMHIKMYMRNDPNLTYEEAVEKFRGAVVASNIDRTLRPTRVANDFAKLATAASYKSSNSKKDKTSKVLPDIYDQMFITATKDFESRMNEDPVFSGINSVESNIEYELMNHYLPALQNGNITQSEFDNVVKDYQEQLKGLPSLKTRYENAYRQKFQEFSSESPADGISVEWGDSRKKDFIQNYFLGSRRLLEYISSPSDPSVESKYNELRYGKAVDLSIGNTPSRGYIVNTKGVKLDASIASSLMGVNRKDTSIKLKDNNGKLRDFEDMLSNGEFGNVIMVPKNSMFTTQNKNTPTLGYRNSYYISTAAIASKLDMNESEVEKYFKNKMGEDCIVKNIDAKEYDESSSAARPRYNEGTYIRFDGNELIPNSGIRRMSLNQAGTSRYGGNTLAKDEYPGNIDQSYTGYGDGYQAYAQKLITEMQ